MVTNEEVEIRYVIPTSPKSNPIRFRQLRKDYFDLRAETIQSAYLRGRQRQAIGGIVLLALSDNQHFESPAQPTALGPIGVPPVVTDRLAVEPAILFDYRGRDAGHPAPLPR